MQALIKKIKQFLQRIIAVGQPIVRMVGNRSRHHSGPDRSTSRRSSGLPTKLDWVIPGKVAVGGLPKAKQINLFTQSKIQVILSLCAPSEGDLPPEIKQSFNCVRLILPDSRYSAQLTAERLVKAVDVLQECDRRGMPIYVHCLAGIERSPTVCIAYLCCVHQLELWEAFQLVKRARPLAAPSHHQIQVIRKLMQMTQSQTQ
ncbi:MAG: dual specificity protein phosphatase family protein [Aphanocapsa sp. GSE-SYN-MK-11-07L]|nr:dual specificity protein phosphatase family protein [Aphanocapsa sp. GSE-SYN-MK-11-07L]